MTRIVGPTGSRRRRRFLFLPILLIAAAGLYMTAGAQAIHVFPDSSLELDGNVADSPAGAPADWNNFYPSSAGGGASFTTGIVTDPEPETIFTGAQSGGSSKDAQEISGWRWKCGSVPAKDEISNAASARYDVSGESRLYFMADREAVNGDSHVGVWFLKKSLAAGPCPAPATEFDDPNSSAAPTHSARTAGTDGIFGNADDVRGDILILADFTQGGSLPNIKVFEWYGTGGNTAKSDGTLNDVAIGGDCIGYAHPPSPDLCATVNSTLLGPGSPDGPAWPYTPKSGAAQSYPAGSFFEGGVDLSAFGLSGECFGSVLTETRSSAEISAVLKDFVLHGFQPCQSGIVTTPSSTSISLGDPITDSATVTGTGAGTPTGTVKFFICNSSQLTSGRCQTGGTQVIKTGSTADGEPLVADPNDSTKANATSGTFNPDSVGTWCWRGVYVPALGSPYTSKTDDTTGECFQVVQLQPDMTTQQRFRPNDSAHITVGLGAGDLAGSVQFQLFVNSSVCGGTAAYDSGAIDVTTGTGTGRDRTVSTNNTTEYVTTGTTFSWLVKYTTTNTGHKNVTASCNAENSSITIANGGTFNTP
jgi:hypothetical protein